MANEILLYYKKAIIPGRKLGLCANPESVSAHKKYSFKRERVNNRFQHHISPAIALMQMQLHTSINDLLFLFYSGANGTSRHYCIFAFYKALKHLVRASNCHMDYIESIEQHFFYYFATSVSDFISDGAYLSKVKLPSKIINNLWLFAQYKRPKVIMHCDHYINDSCKQYFDNIREALDGKQCTDKVGFDLAKNLIFVLEYKTNKLFLEIQDDTHNLIDLEFAKQTFICKAEPIEWFSATCTQYDNFYASFRVSLKISGIYTKIYTSIISIYHGVIDRKVLPNVARDTVSELLALTLFLKPNVCKEFLNAVEETNNFICIVFSATLYEMELKFIHNKSAMVENMFKLIYSTLLHGPFNKPFQLLTYKDAIVSYRQAKKHNRPGI